MFEITPTDLDAGVLNTGDSTDLEVLFTGVPPDVSGTGTLIIGLGGTSTQLSLKATADNPEPRVVSINMPQALVDQGIRVTVPEINSAGATIRISRVSVSGSPLVSGRF